jgi:hypothetical protein
MKTKKINLFATGLLALSFSLFSCSGDDGGIGPDGLKGEQGIQGVVGPAGGDGSIIYSGEGEPATDTGIEGDYYLDVATGMLYGPKVNADNWTDTDGFSLMGVAGTDGTNGTDGSKTLSGTGIPDASLGNAGDFYLDKENSVLYGPKANLIIFGSPESAWWGIGLQLKGADGNANVRTFKYTATDWTAHQNTSGMVYKWLDSTVEFTALNKDVYDNGFVLVYWYSGSRILQLPWTSYTSKQNLKKDYHHLEINDNVYSLVFKRQLQAYADATEVLSTNAAIPYKIIVVTGQAAVQLKANKDNQVEFDRLAGELAK